MKYDTIPSLKRGALDKIVNITGSKRLMLDDQATKLVLIMSMVMIILKIEKEN